uniref:Uncharacterized protein n=1 Tax=Romanomermis culicivorax TaxID=13658 RepID=A0A915IPP3_ROMCU
MKDTKIHTLSTGGTFGGATRAIKKRNETRNEALSKRIETKNKALNYVLFRFTFQFHWKTNLFL